MVPDHRVRLDVPTDSTEHAPQADAPPTLYALVMALAEQQENHLQAIARVGERLTAAEQHISILLREVGREPDSDVRERVVGGGP